MKKELTVQDWGMMIGRKVMHVHEDGETYIDVLVGLIERYDCSIELNLFDCDYVNSRECKPILKRLENISEEDSQLLDEQFGFLKTTKDNGGVDIIGQVKLFDWLTQKGYDIRGWIDAGLAIDYKEVDNANT